MQPQPYPQYQYPNQYNPHQYPPPPPGQPAYGQFPNNAQPFGVYNMHPQQAYPPVGQPYYNQNQYSYPTQPQIYDNGNRFDNGNNISKNK